MKETPPILWLLSKLCTFAGLNCCLLLAEYGLGWCGELCIFCARRVPLRKRRRAGSPVPAQPQHILGLGYNKHMALACSGRATLSRAAASPLGTRAASATVCSVAPRLRSSSTTSSPGVTPLTRKGSAVATAANAWVSNVATCNVSRRQLSSGGGDVDYSSLMAGPGTALHDDIMESAARKQTG